MYWTVPEGGGMRSHAKLSAIGSARWMNCPGSVKLEEQFPDVESEYAWYGSKAHTMAEFCLRQEIDAVQFDTMNPAFREDEEMVVGVQNYIDYVRTLEGDRFIEQRVDFSP